MIKKLVSHLGEYKRAAVLTPLFAALEAVMDVLLPTIMAFIIDQGIEKGDMNAILKYGLLTFLVAAIALLLGVLMAATLLSGCGGKNHVFGRSRVLLGGGIYRAGGIGRPDDRLAGRVPPRGDHHRG